jgi:hypothetical protein
VHHSALRAPRDQHGCPSPLTLSPLRGARGPEGNAGRGGYDVSTLSWANPEHRYAIVRAILVRGDDQAAHWLGKILTRSEVRALVRQYRGAGCNEPERRKLRRELRLTVSDIPNRPYLGFEWPSRA